MEITVHTDHNIEGTEAFAARVQESVASGLPSLGEDHVRIEVHVADESAGRTTPSDVRCTLEVRTDRQSPVSATHHAESVDAAVAGAVHRVRRLIEGRTGRLENRDPRATIRGHG